MPIRQNVATPYWTAPGARLYLGDVRACLRALPARSVHCCVTSPPYWGLRDYGTGEAQIGAEELADCLSWATDNPCGACFVCHMVEVFSEVRRVLRDDGTLWLNLGDTYSAGSRSGPAPAQTLSNGNRRSHATNRVSNGLPGGNIVGVPWHVALALQADGWILRQDIIWHSPNKMPESVQNRCTKSHEHIFLLAKGGDYYYDSVAIEEPAKGGAAHRSHANGEGVDETKAKGGKQQAGNDEMVNKRDVWIVPTSGYPGAHFATYSPRLITPCILAGTSEHGACAECGRPYERLVARTAGIAPDDGDGSNRDRSFPSQRNGLPGSGSTLDGEPATRETVGWRKVCGCQTSEVVPCVVLDPFVGSGTTVATALELGRHGLGIDLLEVYLKDHAIPRIEGALRGEGAAVRRKRPEAVALVEDRAPPPPRRLR